jgi:hypothetical protein
MKSLMTELEFLLKGYKIILWGEKDSYSQITLENIFYLVQEQFVRSRTGVRE